MYWCLLDRNSLLRHLPQRGVVAEIGTYEGVYAEAIARTCEPQKLFLIDKWDFSDSAYALQAATYPNRDGDAVFSGIQKKFAPSIAAGQVQPIRADSLAAAARFAPGTFDWVYIDCDHRYEAVLADLEAYARVLKPDGLLLGHDFEERTFELVKEMDFGVADAVREFIKRSGFEMLLVTGEGWATYCLVRNQRSAVARNVIGSIRAADIRITDMGDALRLRFHWDSMTVDGKVLHYRRIEYVC